ncbi:MAG: exodeoxyribonuclease III [Pseudomonadota bacterium]
MKITSWNVNSLKVRLEHVLDFIERHQPDVLGLQETKLTDDKFPVEAFREVGYHADYVGQPTYNGVAMLSPKPGDDLVREIPDFDDPHKRVIAGTYRGVRVINLYVVNGKAVGDEKYVWKLKWLEAVTRWIERERQQHEQLVVIGDFNIAPDDRDVYDPDEWNDQILCSEPERNALQGILALGLHDSYRLFEQPEREYSWYDYRQMAFRRKRGLRIDLCLISDALKPRCVGSAIDLEPRRLERPSDHAPVTVELSA